MRILPPVEEKLRRAIREARAKTPLISIVALQETLERQFNRTFTREYLAKLSDKVENAQWYFTSSQHGQKKPDCSQLTKPRGYFNLLAAGYEITAAPTLED
jgi:hypothetical protein